MINKILTNVKEHFKTLGIELRFERVIDPPSPARFDRPAFWEAYHDDKKLEFRLREEMVDSLAFAFGEYDVIDELTAGLIFELNKEFNIPEERT